MSYNIGVRLRLPALLLSLFAVFTATTAHAHSERWIPGNSPTRIGAFTGVTPQNRIGGYQLASWLSDANFELQLGGSTSANGLSITAHASGSGLFQQRDPAGFADSVNLYAGMRWDPINNRDPTGEFTGFLAIAAGAAFFEYTGIAPRIRADALAGSAIIHGWIATGAHTVGDGVADATGNDNLGALIASDLQIAGGLVAVGPNLVGLPGAVAKIPEDVWEGGKQATEGFGEGNSAKAWNGVARVSGGAGTALGLLAGASGLLRGRPAPLNQAARATIEGARIGSRPLTGGPLAPPEVLYRTISFKHLETLSRTGRMPGTGETTTSPTLEMAEQYGPGATVRFELQPGTISALEEVGISDGAQLTQTLYPNLCADTSPWALRFARFKTETLQPANVPQVNIQLGKGPGLEIFNNRIMSWREVSRRSQRPVRSGRKRRR